MTISRRTLLSASALLLARPRGVLAETAPASVIHPATDARPEPLVLCWNENPYGPSPAARAVLSGAVNNACRYPEAEIATLMDALAKKEGVSAEHIVTGSGSGELLCALGGMIARQGGEIISAEPTYLEMTGYAQKAGATVKTVPVDAALKHDLKAMRAAVSERTRAVYVCNPNNPTGTAVPRTQIVELAMSLPPEVTLIVDEAYMDFTDDPAVGSVSELVGSGRRIVILRTFSKIHGMAGVRCGYAVTRPDIAAEITDARQASPSIFAMRAALASLGDQAFLTDTRRRIIASRQRILRELKSLNMAYAEPQGNFVFFDTGMLLQDFSARMLAKNIRVGRRFPPYENWCRITIGREPEVDAFITALRAVRAEHAAAKKVG
jgi:histidinol-phosphate aminotransferase